MGFAQNEAAGQIDHRNIALMTNCGLETHASLHILHSTVTLLARFRG
jgi:hypothetical protein